jgi:uncharacterized protein (TIGR01777 family)
VDESIPAAEGFLPQLVVEWENEAVKAERGGVRVVIFRTGLILDPGSGLLKQLLPPFKLGVGGPLAGGDQYMPWIHLDDEVGLILWAVDNGQVSGVLNATAPNPVTNREFSKALGRALHRPAFAPVPALAIHTLYGEMAEIVTKGQRVVPKAALEHGYAFAHPDLDEALRSALG